MSGNNVRMSIFTQEENVERPAANVQYESDMKIYSTISRIARWPWRAAELASNARIA